MYKYILLLVLFLSSSVYSSEQDDALIKAIINGNIKEVKTLIKDGAKSNYGTTYDSKTPLIATALMIASSKGHTEIVELLIDSDADIDVKDNYGYTALMWASRNRNTRVIKLLKDAGAIE